MTQVLTATLAALSILAAGALPAHAESAEARAACTPSVFELCPRAAFSGNREMAKACLLRNLSKASARCQAAVRAAAPERVEAPAAPPRRSEASR